VLFQNKQLDTINIKFHCHQIIVRITVSHKHDKYGYLKMKHVNKKSEIHESYYWPKTEKVLLFICTSF